MSFQNDILGIYVCFMVFVSMSYMDIYGRCDLHVLNL